MADSERARWAATAASDAVHVVPLHDLIEHELLDGCVCGPRTEPVPRPDGSMGWMLSHHSLDGREQREVSPDAG